MSTHYDCVPDSVAGAAADAKIEALRTSVNQVSGRNQTWSWKRPKWHGTSPRVGIHMRRATIDEIFGSIKKDADCIFEHFDTSCFGAYRRVAKGGPLCTQAFHFVMSMEITLSDALADEMWFRIGDVNIRFSKVEFALVTGLRFGNASIDPTANHTPPRSGIHQRLFNGRQVRVKDIFMEFTAGGFEGCSPLDRVKIIKILFLYYQLMGVDYRRKYVENWVWTLVEDDAAWDAFPWGLYSYQFLLQNLKAVRVDDFRYDMFGNISAFLCWVYEAIPPLAAIYAKRLPPPSTQIPRALRWKFQSLKFGSLKVGSLNFDKFPCLPMLEITPEEEKCYHDWWPAVLHNMSATSLLRKENRTSKRKREEEKESSNAEVNKSGDETSVGMSTRKRVSKKSGNSEGEIHSGQLQGDDAGCDFVDSPIENTFQTFPRSDEAPSSSRPEVLDQLEHNLPRIIATAIANNNSILTDSVSNKFEKLMKSLEFLCNSERTQHAVSLDKHGHENQNPIKMEQGINRALEEKVRSLEKEIDALNTKQLESERREEKLRECHAEAERGLKELRARVSELEVEKKASDLIMEVLRQEKLEAEIMLKESERRNSEELLGLEKEIDLLKRRECSENKILDKLKTELSESMIRELNIRERHEKGERSLEELQTVVSNLEGERRADRLMIEELRRGKSEADEIVKESRKRSLEACETVKVSIRRLENVVPIAESFFKVLRMNVGDLVGTKDMLAGEEDGTDEHGMTGQNVVGPSDTGDDDEET